MPIDSRSRVEDILNVILGNLDPSVLQPPQSRVEALLQKLNEMISDFDGKIPVHICTSGEYDHETLMPTIEDPNEDEFYLVPANESGDDMYIEWIFTEGNHWERFGSGGGTVTIEQSDWNQNDSTQADFIKNKPDLTLKLDKNQGVANHGRVMTVNSSGVVVPAKIEGGNITVTETLETGEDYSLGIEGDGTGGVSDVKVGGATVVNQGVANIPLAGTNSIGAVKIAADYGLVNDNELGLKTDPALAGTIKTGLNTNKPIVPSTQHTATFYGLAKAAGDSTQSLSANMVGTYTDAAKDKILSMLGVSDLIAASEGSTASKAYSVGEMFIFNGKLHEATDTIAIGDAIVSGVNCDVVLLGDKVTDLKSEIDFVIVHMPPGYKAANWANGSGTRLIKWMGTYLRSYLKVTSAGAVSGNEVGFGSASITLDSSVTIDMRNVYNAKFICKYTNTFPSEAECYINLRFLTPSLTSPSSAIITLPPGTNKSLTIDINNLALKNNINTSAQPMVILRVIGYKAHTSTGVEEFTVDAYGFEFEDKPLYINSTSLDHNMFRTEPYYAHLFINTFSDAAADTYVPSQSAYDIEIAKRLGFNSIEFNTHVLSDDNIIVLHGSNGTFGTEFAAASGSSYTDAQIQATTISSVNLDWVRQNVVYKSRYPKMQTPPLTLAEALHICRENNMIPFLHRSSEGIVDIADGIMGKDNYILYSGTRADRAKSKAVFCTFSNLSENDIYAYVQAYGTPCIVGTSDYSKFTLSKWAEIVENVHKMGGMMAFAASYMTSSQCDDLWSIGFDMAASGWSLNPCNSGNLVNLCADVGFSDFTVTDGTEANAQLTMSANGTVAPASALSSCFLSGMWLDVTFVGSISVSMGRWITHQNSEVSSETSRTIHLSTYALNSAPTFEIKATSADTVIENIVFKASKL